jgi:hypothetical protein
MKNDNKILIVEGGNDEKVVIELVERRKVVEKFQIRVSKGIPNIFKEIDAAIKLRNFNTIGIIMDADINLGDRWDEIRQIFQENGYKNLPSKPAIKGTIVIPTETKLPKIGVWLMPDNQIAGNLETFITFLIPNPEQDLLFQKAKKVVEDLISNEENKFSNERKDKATLHTWLAWQKKPGLSLGQAVSNRYRELLDDSKADTFIQWLQKLFKD